MNNQQPRGPVGQLQLNSERRIALHAGRRRLKVTRVIRRAQRQVVLSVGHGRHFSGLVSAGAKFVKRYSTIRPMSNDPKSGVKSSSKGNRAAQIYGDLAGASSIRPRKATRTAGRYNGVVQAKITNQAGADVDATEHVVAESDAAPPKGRSLLMTGVERAFSTQSQVPLRAGMLGNSPTPPVMRKRQPVQSHRMHPTPSGAQLNHRLNRFPMSYAARLSIGWVKTSATCVCIPAPSQRLLPRQCRRESIHARQRHPLRRWPVRPDHESRPTPAGARSHPHGVSTDSVVEA